MSLVFANPLGFLALLGIPLVLAIHLLQRTSRRVVVSTLFLLEQLPAVSAAGRRLDRLRNSVPLWLQLLAVLLLTWLLVQPRFLREDSEQFVVAVLDSSVSMSAFRERALGRLAEKLGKFRSAAARTHWILLETDPARPTLYSGDRLEELIATAEQWQPRLGTHDFAPALREAVVLARGGSVLFVTDHPVDTPAGASVLSVGEPVRNCGFCGVRADAQGWRVLVSNYGDAAQKRALTVDGVPRGEVSLEAGRMVEVSGTFPESGRTELRLEGDAFGVDDWLPIVRPVVRPLQLRMAADTPFDAFFRKLSGLVEAQRPGGPELSLAVYDPLAPAAVAGRAIVFAADPGPPGKLLTGDVVAEPSPLTGGLLWDGFQCRDTLGFASQPGDRALLWQDDRPLIFLRGAEGREQLMVNFDLRHSNAPRWPAFVILLHRFAESVRASGTAPETVNAELGQTLSGGLRAPVEPGLFDLGAVGGAVHFADVREADFRGAAAVDTTGAAAEAVSRRNRNADPLAPVWVLLLGGALMANWFLTGQAAGPVRSPLEQT